MGVKSCSGCDEIMCEQIPANGGYYCSECIKKQPVSDSDIEEWSKGGAATLEVSPDDIQRMAYEIRRARTKFAIYAMAGADLRLEDEA